MENDRLYIKNMVCNRCIMVVRDLLTGMGFKPLSVDLGSVRFPESITREQRNEIEVRLKPLGFELIGDRRNRLVERIKNAIIELVHRRGEGFKTNLSDYLANKLHHDYSHLSAIFSETENTTIEKYYIAQRIERVKELLVYDELSLNDIADMLNYSSAAHLSAQFKKVTGLTPSHFKKIKENKRKPIDKV